MMLRWRSFPLKEEPYRALLVLSISAVFLYIAYDWTKMWFLVVLCGGVLFLSLRRFFLPTEYRLDDEWVTVTTAGWERRRRWSEFKNAYFHRVGVHLSPFERPNWLDSFRGLFLRYSGNGEEVERFVKERLKAVKGVDGGNG